MIFSESSFLSSDVTCLSSFKSIDCSISSLVGSISLILMSSFFISCESIFGEVCSITCSFVLSVDFYSYANDYSFMVG